MTYFVKMVAVVFADNKRMGLEHVVENNMLDDLFSDDTHRVCGACRCVKFSIL